MIALWLSLSAALALDLGAMEPGLPLAGPPASSIPARSVRVALGGGVDLDRVDLDLYGLDGASLGTVSSDLRPMVALVFEVGLPAGLALVTGHATPTYVRYSVLDEAQGRAPLSMALAAGVGGVDGLRFAGGVQASATLPLGRSGALRPIGAVWWQPHSADEVLTIDEGELASGEVRVDRARTQALTVPIGLELPIRERDGAEVALGIHATFALPLGETWAVDCKDCNLIIGPGEARSTPAVGAALRVTSRTPEKK